MHVTMNHFLGWGQILFKAFLYLLSFFGMFFVTSTSVVAMPKGCEPKGELAGRLRCIEGLTVKERPGSIAEEGYRVFDLKFEQPLDHNNLDGPKFRQKLVLHHVSDSAPMILQTSGYAIFGTALTEVASHFRANQIQVEHRFFDTSVPSPEEKDWKYLNIVQSAADFHRITVNFKKQYTGKWLNTGASKGGMTSVFHRRFYPEDLDGTLAIVAPLSYSTSDKRYIDFLDNVGGNTYKDCRKRIENLQSLLLEKREEILPKIKGEYETLGSKDIAFEHAVYELPFAFWQYGNPFSPMAGCGKVPGKEATVAQMFKFLETVNDVEESYSDGSLKKFIPYLVQAANQLGGPAAKLTHLADLAKYEDTYDLKSYIPDDAPHDFDPEAMKEIQGWVQSESSKIMFIYGEYDPWTAGAYKPGVAENDNYFYVAPRANHGAKVNLLSENDRKKAWTTLAGWLGIPEKAVSTQYSRRQSLEDLEFKALRSRKVRQ